MSETPAGDRIFGPRAIYWRCFHCGEGFTKKQARWARQHFGADQDALPACQMRLPGEHNLLNLLRQAEEELSSYRAEDTELWRALYASHADHAAALRREEERGYDKGLADGRALSSETPAQQSSEARDGLPLDEPPLGESTPPEGPVQAGGER